MKVFWSWQSDTPKNIGRFLIRDALKDAIEQLRQSDIEEAVRNDIDLDSDIQNTTGSPDIAQTIFRKIDASDVIVADVTIVGEIFSSLNDSIDDESKKLINSNVAIELGYALRARSDANVLMVFNEHYGSHQDLPFDLRHKGGAVVFQLPPDADKKRIAEERAKLKTAFVRVLKLFLKQNPTPQVAFQETPATFNKAAYFENGEVLSPSDGLSYRTPRLAYLRLIPRTPLPEQITMAKVTKVAGTAPFLQRPDHSNRRLRMNKYGVIAFTDNNSELVSSTQFFENGEIWCVTNSLILTERSQAGRFTQLPHLSAFHIEEVYVKTARDVLRFAQKELGIGPPWNLEVGLSNIERVHLTLTTNNDEQIQRNEITHRGVVTRDLETLNETLLSFFRMVFDVVGEERPPNLHGFPPDCPRP